MKLNQRVKTPIGHGTVVGRISKELLTKKLLIQPSVPEFITIQIPMRPDNIKFRMTRTHEPVQIIYAFKPEDLK